jgi:acetolactate synthase I/II/III large subunit
MGFALPAAIGAKIARPDAEVWVVVGDGGFQMTMASWRRSRRRAIKVNVAIINNGYLGMVRQWQEFFYERRYAATPLRQPRLREARRGLRPRRRRVDERARCARRRRGARAHRAPS